jgi:uncharacterized protein (TIGR00369 family)
MEPRTMGESTVTTAQVMNPLDANPAGNVHGGTLMKLIDTAAAATAVKHSGSNCVTASVDRLDFHNPVSVGDLVTLRACVNHTGRSSMEVGVRVESQNLFTGETCHTVTAYLTLVALGLDGKPTDIPPLILETPDEERRNGEAHARRKMRQGEKIEEEAS